MRERSWIPSLVVAALAAALPASGARAAAVTGVILGTDYRHWIEKTAGPEDATISQGGGRLVVGLRLASTTNLILSNAGASSRLGIGSDDETLAGLGSISAALQVHAVGDRLLLRATMTPPSGKRHLSVRQSQVVEQIGLPLLGFPLRHYGTGFEAGGTAAWGLIQREGYRVSIGAGGLTRGSYQLFESGSEFHPASEWATTVGLDLGASSDHPLPQIRLDLTYRGFGTDKLGDVEVFHEGRQLELQAESHADPGAFHWSAMLRGVLKSDNTSLRPAGSSIASFKAKSGNFLSIPVAVDWDAGDRTRLGFALEGVLVTGSDALGRNGNVIGLGPHARFVLAERTALDLTGQYWLGRSEGEGGVRYKISGFSIACALRWLEQ